MKNNYIIRCFCRLQWLVVLVMLCSRQASAQAVANYSFAATTGTFTALTGATSPALSSGTVDDGTFAALPIGFDFWYMGSMYTTVSASTNGWLAMGSSITDNPSNDLQTNGTRPLLAPLWDDLSIAAASNVSYRTTGTAGSRIFTLQYLNVRWNYQATGAVISFQVQLSESSGKVSFIYRQESTAVSSASASIGITAAGTGSGNFLSVSGSATVSSTTQSSITAKPTSGRICTFTPPVPAAPTGLSFSAVTASSMTLSWADNSTNEAGFAIYRSTDGINYTFASQTAANVTSAVQGSLTKSTTYYWRVYAVSEGGLSTALSGSQATACAAPAISQLPANPVAYYKAEGNATDAAGSNSGTLQGAPAAVADRFNNAGKALAFNGTSQYISTANQYVNPSPMSVSIWFKTTTTTGGTLIGFSSMQTGTGGSRDRFVYMTSTGTLYFGLAPGAVKKSLNTTVAYNDGNWHMATATVGAGGMKLYVDGQLAASNLTVTSAEVTTGYWRIGHSDLATWPNEPTSYFFDGTLDDAAIYHKELTASEISTLYISPDGAGNDGPVCAGSNLTLSATTVSGASYSWSGPNGFTSTAQNPVLNYTAAAAGTYTLQATTAACAAIATAYTRVASSPLAGQWTGNVSTDWANANNWCDGILPTASVNVTIPAGATNMPTISSSVSCRDLTISAGAVLTTTVAGTLNISGTLTSSGTMTNNGTTNFNGTAGQQSFTGVNTFYNLTVSNAGGLLLPAATTVNNNLTLAAGSLNTNNFGLALKGAWINNAGTAAFTAGTATVTFNGTTPQTIGGSFATTFNNLTIASVASTVTLAQNAGIAGNLSVTSGTFDLAAFTANRSTAGGNLSVANNATLKIGGTNTFPSNYTGITLVVASFVEYSGANQTVAAQAYGNLSLSSSGGSAVKTMAPSPLSVAGNFSTGVGAGTGLSFTAAADMSIGGNVALGAGTTFNGGSFTHSVGGSWTNNGTFNGNTGTLVFSGTGASVGGSGVQAFNNLTVAAAAVAFTNGALSLSGNLATTGSGSFSQASGGTLTMSGASKTISGSGISLDNLTISGSVSTAASLTLTGNLSVSGSFTASTGTLTMSGIGKTISGAGTSTFSRLSVAGSITTASSFSIGTGLNVGGSFTAAAGTASFTGTSSLSGTANLYNVTVNGTSLQLTAGATLGVANQLTIAAGTLDVTSFLPNTVTFNGNGPQSINGITYHNLRMTTAGSKTATAAITVNNDLTIGTGATFVSGTFIHSIYGNWLNSGAFTAGSGTIRFTGTSTSNVTGITAFNTLTVDMATSATAVALQSDISAATVNMTLGTLLTGSSTINITTTRTGNGIILGNIQRTHAFTPGVPYAFESPDNTITPTGSNLLTSITVSVAVGAVSDFPQLASVNRVYTISLAGNPQLSAFDLRLHYEDAELNGTSESAMQLWRNGGSGWAVSGKTGNNTTSNYVEQTALSSITGRWTLSATTNLVRWNGSVSSDWATPANWTVVQGSASAPPSIADIAEIGVVSFTNHPTISSSAVAKSIILGSAKAANLTLSTGGSLTVAGNITGSWSTGAVHTISAGSQAITVNGDLTLSDGTAGHAINLGIGSGSVSVLGSLTQSGGAAVSFGGAGTLNVTTNFNYTNGTFTAGTGTVIYNGGQNQSIGAVAYNHLTISKMAGLATVNSALSVAGNLTVTAGELDNFAASTIKGNVSIASGAILRNYDTMTVSGNWSNAGTFGDAGGGVFFTGAGSQSVSASTFNNLTINKPVGATVQLTGDVNLLGNLRVLSGTVDLQSFHCDRTVVGGSAVIADSATIILAGTAPFNFATLTVAPSSLVIFNGTGPQSLVLPGVSLGNIIFRNGGAKTIARELTVEGNLTIESGSNLSAGSQILTLKGNWTNNGTFTAGGSTVLLNGISKTITGTTTFNNVVIAGSYQQASNVTYDSLLSITSTGSISSGSGIFTTMNGNLLNKGVLNTSGTTTFSGLRPQMLDLVNATTFALIVNFNGSVSPVLNSTSAPQFGYLNINNTGGVNPSVGWNVVYTLTVGAGASFNGGISTHTLSGDVLNNGTITSNGILNFNPATPAAINLGTQLSSTGTVVFSGAGAITLSGTPAALYNVRVSNTNAAGVTPSSAWTIANNFTIAANAIFNAGSNTVTVGGNLTNTGTLNSGTSTFVLNGSANQDISCGNSFNNLTLNKAAGKANLLTNVTVNGTLRFQGGTISTGANQVVVPASGTVTGAAQNTGWVNGNLKKNISTGAAARSFEIGDGASYTPVSVAFSNVSTAGDLTAYTTTGEHPAIASSRINPTKDLNRYWTLSNSGVAFDYYSATYNFKAADIDGGANTAAFGVALYSNASWMWPAVTAANPLNIQVSGVTSFGAVAVGEVCNAGTAISYPASPYCSNAGMAAVTLTGTTGGTFSAPAGLSLNTGTGAITLATSTAGNYDVVYLVAASGGCPVYTTSTSVTITAAPQATIAYTDSLYCPNGGKGPVSFTGTAGGTFSAGAGLALNAATGEIILVNSTPGTYTVTYTVAAGGGCAAFTTTAAITIKAPGTWTGALGTGWSTGGNWLCEIVPNATTNVTIPAGLTNYPLLSSGSSPLRNLAIASGASVTVNGGVMQIGGSIVNAGTFDAGAGAIELNGSTAQTIPAAAFAGNTVGRLIINNAAGVTLAGSLAISAVLTPALGTFNGGGYLTLLSTAAQTALIDGSGTGQVLGKVTMQRYLASGFGYKYLSSPFQAATVSELADDIPLNAAFPTLYRYDESLATSGWVSYTNPAGSLNVLQGYIANVDSLATPKTISMSGVVNNGTLSSPTLYNNNKAYTAGFNLIGNPYPSPIDWDAASGWSRSNLDNAVYYFNAGTSNRYRGSYSAYVNGISSDGIAGKTIPAMQGFFVHVSNGTFPVTATLTINNSARINNLNPVFHKGTQNHRPLVRLAAGFSEDGAPADPAAFYFDDAATTAFDKDYDALKLMNTDDQLPSIYSIAADGSKLAINALPTTGADSLSIIPLGIRTEQAGQVRLTATGIEDMPFGCRPSLYDAATGVVQDLEENPRYEIRLEKGSHERRFFLAFSRTALTAGDFSASSFHASYADGKLTVDLHRASGGKGEVIVTNSVGQIMLRQALTGTGRHALEAGWSPGIYIVSVSSAEGIQSQKVLIASK
jgi:hypothetical protein